MRITRKAVVTSELELRDRVTKKTKHREAEVKQVNLRQEDGPHGVVKTGAGVTLSLKYQSVVVSVGVELPWPCRPGEVDDLKEGFDKAYCLIDDELAARAKDVEKLLSQLVSKYGR